MFVALALMPSTGAALAQTPPAQEAAPLGQQAQQPDCFEQLVQSTTPRIVCSVPLVMSTAERAEIVKLTRGFFKDAQCTLRIDIARRLIDDTQAAPDHVFESPPQPVACDIATSRSNFPVTFSFAPRVTFKQGQAVEATPGMGDIQGVGRILSWPIETWVNSSDQIEEAMVRVINAFFVRFGRNQPTDPAPGPGPDPSPDENTPHDQAPGPTLTTPI